MHRYLITAAALTCLLSTTALAQTATGVGVGTSTSNSAAGAVAISGQGGQGGNVIINNPPGGSQQSAGGASQQSVNTTGDVTSRLISSGTTTSNVNQSGTVTNRVVSSGTTTVRTAPSMVAPGLAAAGLETCLGSASGTVSAIGFGIGGGSTYADEGCQARLDSRTLYAYGLKQAAVARLCQRADIWRSMPDVCAQNWPAGQAYPAGIVMVEPSYRASVMLGSIEVIDGKSGRTRPCSNYSHTKYKCYAWADEAPKAAKPHKVAALAPTQKVGQPVWTRKKEKAEPPKAVVSKPAEAPKAVEPEKKPEEDKKT